MIFHSIKWRILAWNHALLSVVVIVLLVAFYRHECENRLQMTDVKLRQVLVSALPGFHALVPGFGQHRDGLPPPRPAPREFSPEGPPPDGAGGPSGQAAAELRRLTQGDVWCAIIGPRGAITYRSDNAPAPAVLAKVDVTKTPREDRETDETALTFDDFRMILHRQPGDDIVIIGTPVSPLEEQFGRLALELAAIGVAIVGVGYAIGRMIAGRALRPISRISETAGRIAAGDYSRTIDVTETESELGRLATILNGTFSRLNAAREQLVRFTADASHELRTPLAVILASSQSALKRDRTPEEYREAIEAIERAARRMKSLSDALLELAHGDIGKDACQTSPCDLADLADEAVAMLTPLARQHGASIIPDLRSCPVEADPLRLGRAILSLVSNAILHNDAGTHITVTTRVSGDRAVLEVLDTGKGIPPEHLGKIFDRFHRADASRSRHTGGAGLGLAIVKQTVEAHGGSITVKSTVGSGSVFTVTLPICKAWRAGEKG